MRGVVNFKATLKKAQDVLRFDLENRPFIGISRYSGKRLLSRKTVRQRFTRRVSISQQKIHFVTGKGGVGKSAFAAALALKFAEIGEKTLLVELGSRGFFSYVWGKKIVFDPQVVHPNLELSRWDGLDCLQEYFLHLLKVKPLVNLIFENKIMNALVRASPALNELSVLGKATSGIRKVGPKIDYQNIVIDAYATGHFKALLNAPRGLGQAIPKGPMGDQSRQIERVITNPLLTKVYIVTLPEELPVNESLELKSFLQTEFSQKAHFILNKTVGTEVTAKELNVIQQKISTGQNMVSYLKQALEDQKKYSELLKHQGESLMEIENFYLPTSLELYRKIVNCLEVSQFD